MALSLIVGLGNPGAQYETTRHNAGFWFIDELVRRYGGVLRNETKFNGELGRITLANREIWLLKPLTFMNRSGQSIARLAGFYKIDAADILVAHDDLDLPIGTVRLKSGGGHGGHNGLRDTCAQLGSNAFLRLRLGIGRPSGSATIGYVLGRPPSAERQWIDDAIDAAASEIALIAEGQWNKATQILHSRPDASSGHTIG
jgi:PTH1 family peptidyl-tRNA hydrolase